MYLYTHITGFQPKNNYSFNWRLIGFFEGNLLFGSNFKQLSNDSPNRERASLLQKFGLFTTIAERQILEGLNYGGKYSKESPWLVCFYLSTLRADQTLEVAGNRVILLRKSQTQKELKKIKKKKTKQLSSSAEPPKTSSERRPHPGRCARVKERRRGNRRKRERVPRAGKNIGDRGSKLNSFKDVFVDDIFHDKGNGKTCTLYQRDVPCISASIKSFCVNVRGIICWWCQNFYGAANASFLVSKCFFLC